MVAPLRPWPKPTNGWPPYIITDARHLSRLLDYASRDDAAPHVLGARKMLQDHSAACRVMVELYELWNTRERGRKS